MANAAQTTTASPPSARLAREWRTMEAMIHLHCRARHGGGAAPCGDCRTSGSIDFAEINRAALASFPAVLARILPGGKRSLAQENEPRRNERPPMRDRDRPDALPTRPAGR